MLALSPHVTEAILGSTLKIRTLRVLRRYPTREFTTRELAREVGARVVRRRRIGRALAVRANPHSALFAATQQLFEQEEDLGARFQKSVRRWCARQDVEYAELFGSAARDERRT